MPLYVAELQFRHNNRGKTLTFSARRLMLIWRTAVLALGLCLALIGGFGSSIKVAIPTT